MADDLTPAQQRELDYELAHPGQFSCPGLNAFTIIGMVIITAAVCTRFWSRKLGKVPLKVDDYLLLVALALTLGAQSMAVSNVYNAHWCYHQPTLTDADFTLGGKQWYAFGLMYTTSYPIARISLTLLYRRIFIQQWVRVISWFLVFCYTGYAIGSFFADVFTFNPIASGWDLNVKRTHAINIKALYLANSGFNIATDFILLILPLAAIWNLSMSRLRKIGLGFIFCLGCLTCIASIFRLALYFTYNTFDPNYALSPIQWWTHAEMDLGILCPCFVTMQPLLRHGFVYISSQLSARNRSRIEHALGVSTSLPPSPKVHSDENASSRTHINGEKSLRSKTSKTEEGGTQWFDMEDMSRAPPLPSDAPRTGTPVDQQTALASLDPRTNTTVSHTQAERGPGGNTPEEGIGVARDWRLESEKAGSAV